MINYINARIYERGMSRNSYSKIKGYSKIYSWDNFWRFINIVYSWNNDSQDNLARWIVFAAQHIRECSCICCVKIIMVTSTEQLHCFC